MNLPELFLNLVNMSISASWLVLAVLALRFLMKKAPKWMTCSLWALVAIRLIMPFSIESIFSLIPSAHTLPTDIITENRFEINTGIPVINQQINDVLLDSYYEGVTVPVDNGLNVVSVISVIWLVGMILLAVYSFLSYLYLRGKVSASIRLRENIYLCDYIESPFILGLFRPRIYLPSTLDRSNWTHVLAHEQAHLKRRDHWWKPLGYALLCIHWFNPLMWLAYVLLCRDIELACDEKVIRDLGEQSKAAYSEALLECSMPRYLIAACPLAFGEVGVKDRVKSILNYKKPAFWIILSALILSIIAAVCFLTDPIDNHDFVGTVISTNPLSIAVKPEAGSPEAKQYSEVYVAIPENAPEIQTGDTVRIFYDGPIRDSFPPWISNPSRIEVLTELEYVARNYSLVRAIMEGYVVMVNGDVTNGQNAWQEFFNKTADGIPASIRIASYHTIGDPRRMSEELFEDSRDHYPVLYFHELSYDGTAYTYRWIENGLEYVQSWKYLMHYTGAAPSPYATFKSYDCYVLTDRNDVTYEELQNGMFSADFHDQIPFHQVYMDYLYGNEPSFRDLENAKTALEDYMIEYRIASLDANELTGRLDIQVYEWVDGLFDIIEQYVDPHFAVVTEMRNSIEFTRTTYNRVEHAIADGCVVSINGDIVAGHAYLNAFLGLSKKGIPATVRFADFHTLSSPNGFDPGDFPDIFRRTPSMSVSHLVYDGTQYIHRLYSEGLIYESVYPHLVTFSDVTYGRTYRNYYVLTEHEDLSWEEYNRNTALNAAFYRRGRMLCADALYEYEPDLTELEQAKSALTPYMWEYRIASLDVNELTGRLDIIVTEWIDGLDVLVEQHIDPSFVTITHTEGWVHLAAQNDLLKRFPQYYGLQLYMGLDLYAFEDGYVLVSCADKEITEAEIQAMSRTNAGEMALILEAYEHLISVTDIHVQNHTDRTEYDIRKELGIFPQCSVRSEVTGVTPNGATIVFTIHNLDNKEVWTGQEFLLEVMTEDGWATYGHDPSELAWDLSLMFHRQGTGISPSPTYFLTQEEIRCTFSWSAVGDVPLPSGSYRFSKIVYIRDGDETRGYQCFALFDIP